MLWIPFHWKGNAILTTFPSLAAPEFVDVTNFDTANNKDVVGIIVQYDPIMDRDTIDTVYLGEPREPCQVKIFHVK